MMVIAIDGPSGAGKSTVARMVAKRLGLVYIDTGAMYRAVALAVLRAHIPMERTEDIIGIAENVTIRFEQPSAEEPNAAQQVWLGNENVTDRIRDPAVTQLSSPVSAIGGVRAALVARQREMARSVGVVMEGRDIGTVVLPWAELKVFLTASPQERARRRCAELTAKGHPADIAVVAAQMAERDERDSTRSDSPLKPADGSVFIDSDGLSANEVTERIISMARSVECRCSTE